MARPVVARIPARPSRTRRWPATWASTASPRSISRWCRPTSSAASSWSRAPSPATTAAGSPCAMPSRNRCRKSCRSRASSGWRKLRRLRKRRRAREMELKVTTLEGKSAGGVTVSDDIFGLEPRADILQRCVVWQLAKRQAGTHDVKNRAEINRTAKKMYRQKGTGSARHGPARVNLFRGGGRSFGPTPRSHATGLPKKVRALALKHALSAKAKDGGLVVIDSAQVKNAKTKALVGQFSGLGLTNALIIDGAELNNGFATAARNIPNIDVLPIQGINVYDILRRQKLVLTKAALDALEARFK